MRLFRLLSIAIAFLSSSRLSTADNNKVLLRHRGERALQPGQPGQAADVVCLDENHPFTCQDGGVCTEWEDDCNTCQCTNAGTVSCTRVACQHFCIVPPCEDSTPPPSPPPLICTDNLSCVPKDTTTTTSEEVQTVVEDEMSATNNDNNDEATTSTANSNNCTTVFHPFACASGTTCTRWLDECSNNCTCTGDLMECSRKPCYDPQAPVCVDNDTCDPLPPPGQEVAAPSTNTSTTATTTTTDAPEGESERNDNVVDTSGSILNLATTTLLLLVMIDMAAIFLY